MHPTADGKKLIRSIKVSQHYGPIFWQTLGKNPILVGYVVLGIGYGVSAHDLSGYKVLGVEYQNKVAQRPVAKI